MFETLIVQPLFNLLVLILALIPGHNFGAAIIIFTIIIRLLLWPLFKKQLHQTKLMRKIQPELKRIYRETKGDRAKRTQLQMELYKERGISPFRSIGIVLLQLPILFGLYFGLQKVIKDPEELINFAYEPLREMQWLERLADNIKNFDTSLFGLVDLYRPAFSGGDFYFPALVIVAASAVVQYFAAKQLTPIDKDARSLRAILKDAGSGKQADEMEMSAAVSKFTITLLPAMLFIFTIGLASALALYMLVSGIVGLIQQTVVLREDAEEMQELSEEPAAAGKKDAAAIPEAEVVAAPIQDNADAKQRPVKKKASKAKKRRRK